MQNHSRCGCNHGQLDYSGVDLLPLAMAYVPYQTSRDMYDYTTGLKRGTIFPELWKPFCGKGGARR
jgi:hypothetical protein